MRSVRGQWEGVGKRKFGGQVEVLVTFHEHSMIQGCGTLPFVGNRRVVDSGDEPDVVQERHIDRVEVLDGDGIPPELQKASWILTSFS